MKNANKKWKVVMVSEGGTKHDFSSGYPTEEEAQKFAESENWHYIDENQFEWYLEVEEDLEESLEGGTEIRTAIEIINALPSEHRDALITIAKMIHANNGFLMRSNSCDFLYGYLYCLSKCNLISYSETDVLLKWCESEEPMKYFKIEGKEK